MHPSRASRECRADAESELQTLSLSYIDRSLASSSAVVSKPRVDSGYYLFNNMPTTASQPVATE